MAPILTIDCTVLRHEYDILQQFNPSAWNNMESKWDAPGDSTSNVKPSD